MFDQPLELTDVLKSLKRADESLTEFIAPAWPGVQSAAAWMEGKPRCYSIDEAPEHEGFFLFGTEDERAFILREADQQEIHRYMNYLERASVILLEDNLAFPSSFAERLQGITAPRPIHFASGAPLTQVTARFDGINLLFDSLPKKDVSPLDSIFGENSIFTTEDLFDIPGSTVSGGEAQDALEKLRKESDYATECRFAAVLDPAGAVLESLSRDDAGYHLAWRRLDEVFTISLRNDSSPIVSGISLPGARGFDPALLTRRLLDHALDAWTPKK